MILKNAFFLSLFNGMLNFWSYLMQKLALQNNGSASI